jgi:hypothetical protein
VSKDIEPTIGLQTDGQVSPLRPCPWASNVIDFRAPLMKAAQSF